VRVPPWNCTKAMAGKIAVGMPRIVALRSATKQPWIAWRPRRNWKPSATERQPKRVAPPTGRCELIVRTVDTATTKLAALTQ